ncbi:hypothetical protein KMZ68_02765 [Bradyrhizobium sediminis]|uniref:Uncharacterized protein n=1 Tax=Bradyrhizobium sediminis TaxID=2840469 RepID=A0A975NPV4_9BRAD|nr:hypothetical protein [Bradyrhizobium sediminis]QWG18830.1 hypothetical protein KMZ68_02765 [Bradyrhizobium sediminis]
MLDNSGWQARLQDVNHKKFKNCRFPKFGDIGIEGSQDQVTITIRTKGLYGNMQSDAAAFEAWSLALIYHCGVRFVAIRLEGEVDKPEGDPHFERLLYRLVRFAELFQPRILIDDSVARRARALGSKGLFLNEPGNKRSSVENQLEERFEAIVSKPETHSERDLEMALEVSSAFRKELGLDKLMRQWPVGLFDGRVADAQRIFSGVKSAIDLIGIRKETLVLIELKKDGNSKVGALSELLFYSSVMRDALRGIFKFGNQTPAQNCAITRSDIMNCSSIRAVLLAPSIHPLIVDSNIMTELNRSAQSHWSDIPVQFEALRIAAMPRGPGDDFAFGRVS